MFSRYIVKTKQAGTPHEHFIISDTHHRNWTVGVYHREYNARQRVKELNELETSGPGIWNRPARDTSLEE
ncbi:hypothetical protein [Salinicola sp. CPA57]|uniref:hypothetical protein n=1 Tax=Salinicola sp. CPA57 TaxID=1949080 RepID=UPI000DA1D163|nr:hypothetical protein [Salinicola sp. CPA57]